MPVNTPHNEHSDMTIRWQRCRDVVSGLDAIKEGGRLYLPAPTGLDDEEYEHYQQRATFFNATQRTIDAMSGLIFRKDPKYDLEDQYLYLLDRATADGMPMTDLAVKAVEEVMVVGRVSLLVDFPLVENPETRTRAQAEADGDRPFVAVYQGENLTNWRYVMKGSERILQMAVLMEYEDIIDPEDKFVVKQRKCYRELSIETGVYTQTMWRWDENKRKYIPEEPITPLMNNQPMKRIPLYVASIFGETVDVQKPPFLDLVDVNIAHYRNSADYERGLHFTGNPMPVITGWDAGETTVTIGSERALILESPQAKAFYMELTGDMGALKEALKDKKADMASMGTKLLLEETRGGVEAAETAAIRRAGENSVLSAIASSVSRVITHALETMVEWSGGNPEEVHYELNRDYLPFAMSADTITALMGAWQQGVISKETLFQKLQEGEAIPQGVDYERDQELVAEEGMLNLPVVTTAE